MSYQEQITIILPLIFDYLDDPFELIAICKLINTNATKYKIRLIKQHDFPEYKQNYEKNYKIFNGLLLSKFKFKQLKLIDNIVSNFDDDDGEYLKHLEEIQFDGEFITDKGMMHMKNAKKIVVNTKPTSNRSNNIQPVYDRQIQKHTLFSINSLKYIENLHTLSIINNSINDTDLEFLKNLTYLNLYNNNKITDKGLPHLKKIQTLILNQNTHITDAGLQHLIHTKKISLMSNKNIQGTCFIHLKNIEDLSLCHLFTKDIHVKHLRHLKKLETIYDNLTNFSLRHLHNIEELSLYGNQRITNYGMKYIYRVKKLYLSQNEYITYRGLKYLSCIKYLKLSCCDINNHSIKYLRGVSELEIRGNLVIDSSFKILEGIKSLKVRSLTINTLNTGFHPFDQLDDLIIDEFDVYDLNFDYGNKNVVQSIKNTKNVMINGHEIRTNCKLIVRNIYKLLEMCDKYCLGFGGYDETDINDVMNTFLENYYKNT